MWSPILGPLTHIAGFVKKKPYEIKIGFSLVSFGAPWYSTCPAMIESLRGRLVMTEPTRGESGYYTDQDIARLLGISLGRLRNKLTAGNPLPPRIEPPGCRNRLWPRAAVHEWLQQFTVTAAPRGAFYTPLPRRGRLTKREARSRRP